jgi:4'-phosphopantetheinyl transferase
VDVEQHKLGVDMAGIMERFFSPAEYQQWQLVPEVEQQLAFYRYWTLKEAFVKCTGKGLSYPLSDFEVSLAADKTDQLLSIEGDPEQAKSWVLRCLEVDHLFSAAVAIHGIVSKITQQVWRSPEKFKK